MPLALLMPLLLVLSGCGRNLIEHATSGIGGIISLVVLVVAIVALVDLLGDRGRSPVNKIIWALVIIVMPLLGAILYLVLGR
jgi:hypothetical protein